MRENTVEAEEGGKMENRGEEDPKAGRRERSIRLVGILRQGL